MFELTGGLKKVGSDRTRTDPKKIIFVQKNVLLILAQEALTYISQVKKCVYAADNSNKNTVYPNYCRTFFHFFK